MPDAKEAIAKTNDIDQTNFRLVAREAVKKYEKENMLIDALLWGRIIALYEAELAKRGK